eukprot:COSAG02_NODE_5648_length_4153_cov_3.809571_1_plen_399_part_00
MAWLRCLGGGGRACTAMLPQRLGGVGHRRFSDDTVPQTMQLLARGAAAVVRGELDDAEVALTAADHAFRANGGGPPQYSWPLRSSMGQLAFSRGDFSTAKHELEAALELATESSMSGLGDDAFRDLASCLLDLAALELQLRTPHDVQSAAKRVRRAQYMSSHAYRPAAALQRPTQELAALVGVHSLALGCADTDDGNDMVRTLLLDAREDGDVVAEARALVTLAGVALREACELRGVQEGAAEKMLEKAARTARQALERVEPAESSTTASDVTQMQSGGTTLGAAAVLASVNALASVDNDSGCATGANISVNSLVERLGLLPHNQLDRALHKCQEHDHNQESVAAEACRLLTPQLGSTHLAVLKLRGQAAGGAPAVWGLCGSVPVPRCIALRIWLSPE